MGTLVEMPRTAPHVEPLMGLTPWDVCLRLADQKHMLFLDSAQRSAVGRYSFLTADPVHVITAKRGEDPLQALADRLARFKMEPMDDLPPFQGGAAGLLSYELCHHFERLPRARFDDFAIPDVAVGIYDWVVAFDLPRERAWLISTGYPETDPRSRQQRAKRRAEQVKRWQLDRRTVGISFKSQPPRRSGRRNFR